MRFTLAVSLICACAVADAVTIPDVTAFRVVPQYPEPAAGATITLGACETARGRLVLWDGDTVYFQQLNTDSKPGPTLKPSGSGFAGDPSFAGVRSNNSTVILGSGSTGRLYKIVNINVVADFVTGSQIAVPTFETGALMGDRYVLLDRVRDDLSGAEILVVDTGVTPAVAKAVLQKPAGSQPAAIGYNPGSRRVYIMNSTTRELRYFSETALTTAFTSSTPIDWITAGTPVGAIGQFLNGGVSGVATDGTLLLGGDENSVGTGGIQWVDPDPTPAVILDTLDPAGTGPAFALIYSRKTDQVLAIDPSVGPPDAYASTTMIPAIPPDSPCSEFDEVKTEFEAFVAQFSPGATDLDGDTIPDTAMLELINLYSCRVNEKDALTFATNTAYDDNGEVFAMEANAGALAAYSRIVPTLLFMSDAMQNAVLGLLNTASLPLSGTYVTVTCTDTSTCLPLFAEDAFVSRGAPVSYEPYSAAGDADGDTFSNLTEYQNVVAMGGDDYDFGIAAASKQLDGTGGVDGGGGGGCFIATAAYGTPMAAELDRLRAFRDSQLLANGSGAAFVDAYYHLSPDAAAWIAARPAARTTARLLLTPILNPSIAMLAVLAIAAAALLTTVSLRRVTGTVQRK